MHRKLSLDLDQLAVDSFATAPTLPKPGTVLGAAATCLQTNCGRYLCCA